MAKVEIEIADEALARAQQAAHMSHVSLEAWLTQAIDHAAPVMPNTLLGMFADAPELIDTLTEEAMAARDRPLRATHGQRSAGHGHFQRGTQK